MAEQSGGSGEAAIIRTCLWGEEERVLSSTLLPIFGDRIIVAFHGNPPDCIPHKVAAFDDDWVRDRGLQIVPKYGWRCGDYALYRAREQAPEFERYWLIEPDVHFIHAEAFFEECAADTSDLLGCRIRPANPTGRWGRTVRDVEPWAALFCLLRITGSGIDFAREKRLKTSERKLRPVMCPNDEVLVFSYLQAHPEMTVACIEDVAPGWIDPERFRPAHKFLRESIDTGSGSVVHPVVGRSAYIKATAERFLPRQRELSDEVAKALATFDDDDLEQLVAHMAKTFRTRLGNVVRQARRTG